jgi:hypothetical protein
LAGGQTSVRNLEDFDRTIRSLARHFGTDTVFVVGSQAILASWPEAPEIVRMSREVDAYPANAREWAARHGGTEASEEINALFGYGSDFDGTFGFYIDGVDEFTAKLPSDWKERAVRRRVFVDPGWFATAVAPSIEDLVVSKLARFDHKDRAFAEAIHAAKPLDIDSIKRLLPKTPIEPGTADRLRAFLDGLPKPAAA